MRKKVERKSREKARTCTHARFTLNVHTFERGHDRKKLEVRA